MGHLRRGSFVVALLLAACTAASEHSDKPAGTPAPEQRVAPAPAAETSATREASSPRAVAEANGAVGAPISPRLMALRDPAATPVISGLYVNRFAAQSARKMRWLVGVADSTEINGFVIDMKDEFGLNFHSQNAEFRKNEGAGHGMVRDVRGLLDTLHAHNIFAIARIVVFKDPTTAQVNPSWTIRQPDSSIWHDKKNTSWVDPYNRALWDYNIGIAEELVHLGFDEIQFDYIRFPEPYKSLPPQVFHATNGISKPDLLATFLKTAHERLNKLGVRSTADVFGFVTTVHGPLEVGQWWEKLAPVTDVLLPMTYPSHFPHGTFGIQRPNAEPYQIQKISIDAARERDKKLGITAPEHVRPWIQAFSLGKPPYGAKEVEEQKRGIYDAGYDGWVLWHPGSKYEPFLPGLEKGELVSHKKVF
jgi:hypothetical protein